MIPMTLRAPAPDRVAVLCILGSCLFLQLGAALATQLFPHAGTWATSSLRVLIAGVILLAVSRPAMWRWTPEQWGCALVLGVSLGAMNGFFYAGISRIPLGAAVTIEFLGPLLLAAVLSRSVRDGISVLLALIPGQGGLAVALTVGGLATLPFGFRGVLVIAADPHLMLVAVGTSVMASLIPATLELIAMRRLRPQVFSILISFEPAFAALIGWIVLHQDPSALKLAAIALVISASVNQTLAGRRLRKTMPPAV